MRIIGLAILFVLGAAATALAHDKGTLKPASRTFRAGDSLAIAGTKFSPSDEVALALVGVKGKVPLADIPTDSTGAFLRTVVVPSNAPPGQYRLIAEALDGDEVATLDVTVVAGAATNSGAMPTMPGMDHGPGGAATAAEPSGDALQLDRRRSTPVTAGVVASILVFAAAGAWLLRGARLTPTEDVQ